MSFAMVAHSTLGMKIFIEIIGVSSEIAEKDACKIEHIISNETFDGIKRYLQNNNK